MRHVLGLWRTRVGIRPYLLIPDLRRGCKMYVGIALSCLLLFGRCTDFVLSIHFLVETV